jgi:insulysin
MKIFYYSILAVICSQPVYAEPTAIQEIADEANLPFLNPDLISRKTAKIRLANGLEAYIVSDPMADQSAAALAVGAGSWNDPDEYPGMAHFCEHMLFRGSQKFPHDTEFSDLVGDSNGQTNAYTAPNRTVYMFSSSDESFPLLLEHFAHFFIDPLFNSSRIDEEMHAVDQEFAKNIENDAWREYMVFKETGNPEHPNARFSIGNSQTLSNIPQTALKKWHAQYYVAEKMHLVLYTPLPIDHLKEIVQNFFGPIPTHSILPLDDSAPLSSPNQKGHFTYVQPIRQKQTLTLSWELPADFSSDPSKSADLFCYALNRGQPYSLHEQLKKDGYIDDSTIEVNELANHRHRFVQIELTLTQQGLKEINDVIFRCFQAINGLKNSSIPSYLFGEMNDLAALSYQYQPRQNAFNYVSSIGETIIDEPLGSYPKFTLLSASYDPEKIARAGEILTPENCIFSLQADFSNTNIFMDHCERWIGAKYTIQPIPDSQLKIWKDALPHPNIRIAASNPFVPSHFDLALVTNDPKTTIPLLINEDEGGIAYYSRVAEFCAPESVFYLHILTPQINSSSRSDCLASLYLNYLNDRLNATLRSASSAGLETSFAVDRNRLTCSVSGFNDKAPLLLQEILKQLAVPPPTPDQFEQYRDRLSQKLANCEKDLAIYQARDLISTLIYQDKPSPKEKLETLKHISYDDFCSHLHHLFDETYIKAMFCGNLSLKEAESAWLDVRHLLGGVPYLKKNHPAIKVLSLPNDQGPFAIHEKTQAAGNGAFLLLDLGNFSFERRAAQEILSAALKEAFFNSLRGKQKTGYIAHSDHQEIELRLFQHFVVQSNSHSSDELLYRFEQFLESFLQEISETIPASRFATLKQNLAESLLTRFRGLREKSALWNQLAFDNDADFNWVEKRLEGYANLSYETFLKESKTNLSRGNRKRLAVLFDGRIGDPFQYKTVSAPDIEKVSEYLTRSDTAIEKGEVGMLESEGE